MDAGLFEGKLWLLLAVSFVVFGTTVLGEGSTDDVMNLTNDLKQPQVHILQQFSVFFTFNFQKSLLCEDRP